MTLRTISTLTIAAILVAGCSESRAPVLSAQKPVAPSKLIVAVNKALAEGDTAAAVMLAQLQARAQPDSPDVQRTLARAQLADGRYAEALYTLKAQVEANPQDPALSFSYGLALLATGQEAAGRTLLVRLVMTGAPQMASDVGLALALAGDPAGGLSLLEPAARAAEADGRVRQNLGLAYAAKGDWLRARDAARLDLTPDQVDAALARWAVLLQQQTPERIAILLGGSPETLAARTQLTKAAPAALAPTASLGVVAAADLPPPPAPPVVEKTAVNLPRLGSVQLAAVSPLAIAPTPIVTEATPEPAPQPALQAAPQPVPQAAPQVAPHSVQAPRQATQVVRLAATRTPAGVAKTSAPVEAAPAVATSAEAWTVQLGAFSSVDLAKAAWGVLTGRYKLLIGAGSPLLLRTEGTGLTRVVVSGFADRTEARTFCRSYRANGGECFERRVTAAFSTVRL